MDLKEFLDQELADPERAASFLNAILEDTPPEELTQVFRAGVIHVARARGLTEVAEKAGIHRQTFYRTGSLTFEKLNRILTVLGLELTRYGNGLALV